MEVSYYSYSCNLSAALHILQFMGMDIFGVIAIIQVLAATTKAMRVFTSETYPLHMQNAVSQ